MNSREIIQSMLITPLQICASE